MRHGIAAASALEPDLHPQRQVRSFAEFAAAPQVLEIGNFDIDQYQAFVLHQKYNDL